MGKFRFGRRKGGVGSTVLTLLSGCVLIGFCLVLSVKTPDFFGLDVFQPNTNLGSAPQTTQEPVETVEEEPVEVNESETSSTETNEVNITSVDTATQDLESLGCTVTVVERLEGFSNGAGMLLTYPEFKKIAIKEEFVFQYTVEEQSILIIPYEGTFIIWLPEDNEPSETYTKFEKIEIQTGYATYDSTNTFWAITLVIKNSGSEDATVNSVFLNDVPCSNQNYGVVPVPAGDWCVSFSNAGVPLSPGKQAEIHLLIDNGYLSLSSGTTVNVKLHSAGGMDYIKLIRLP